MPETGGNRWQDLAEPGAIVVLALAGLRWLKGLFQKQSSIENIYIEHTETALETLRRERNEIQIKLTVALQELDKTKREFARLSVQYHYLQNRLRDAGIKWEPWDDD